MRPLQPNNSPHPFKLEHCFHLLLNYTIHQNTKKVKDEFERIELDFAQKAELSFYYF